MIIYTIKRVLLAMLIVACAVSTMFLMIHAVPGDPANVMLGPRATPEIKEALRARLHLDQPLTTQLFYFFKGLVSGNFGFDLRSNRPVLDIVLEQLPHTLILVSSALIVSMLGVPVGCYAAIHRNGKFDRIVGAISVSIIAMPAIVVGLYMLLFFSVELRAFPCYRGRRQSRLAGLFMASNAACRDDWHCLDRVYFTACSCIHDRSLKSKSCANGKSFRIA